MPSEVTTDRRLLMIGFGLSGASLRAQNLRLGFLPFEVSRLEDAAREFERGCPLSGIVLLSTTLPRRGLTAGLERLCAVAPRLQLVAVGPEPGDETGEVLKQAGGGCGLWTPVADEDLELVLSLASSISVEHEDGSTRRKPRRIGAQLVCSRCQTTGTIRNLSTAGAFIETDEAFSSGDNFELRFALEEQPLALDARVVYTVDASQASPASRGVGVRLTGTPSSTLTALADFVLSRTASVRV